MNKVETVSAPQSATNVSGNLSSAKKVKKVSIPKHSKRTIQRSEKVKDFAINGSEFSNWERMHVASANAEIVNMGLNKALKHYISCAKGILTDSQLKVLKFNTVITWIESSKYSDLKFFSINQIKLICNSVIKENHLETKRQARAMAQNKKQA